MDSRLVLQTRRCTFLSKDLLRFDKKKNDATITPLHIFQTLDLNHNAKFSTQKIALNQ